MNRLTISYAVLGFLMSTLHLKAENSYLGKEVTLQAGQRTIKETFSSLSNQTGCTFSYDPTIIVDKQIFYFTSKVKLSLRMALQMILPKTIEYKTNGKYIVLRRFVDNSEKNIEKKTEKPFRLFNSNQKNSGKIDNNRLKECLVLPDMIENSDIIDIKEKRIDSALNLISDKVCLIKTTLNDSLKSEQITQNQDTIKPKLKDELQTINSPSGVNIIMDTLIIAKQNFGGFLKKNGFLEVGMSLNKKFGAISVRTGLYNVYSIISIATDYNNSYLFGIGAGIDIKLNNHFSIDFDLLRNSLYAGKTYLLDVRASNTQFSPILNYSIGKCFKISGGPVLHLIKSSYVSSVSSTDLGMLVAIGISVGVKINLKSILFPNS
jgi:hypothetical protein